MAAVEINCTNIRAYSWHAVIIRPGYKLFLTSIFVDGKNILFTVRILSRPTLSIAVTETVVKPTIHVTMSITLYLLYV